LQKKLNVQIPLPRTVTPPLLPQTPEDQISSLSVPLATSKNDEEADSDEISSDEADTDPKDLTFDEYVDGDGGHIDDDDDETPNYNYDEVNVKETKGRRLFTEEINKMKVEYSERYHNIRPENKWKLPSGNFAEDILFEHTLKLEYER